MKETGRKITTSESVVASNRQADVSRRFSGRLPGVHPLLFDEAEDVFQDDDRVVDHDADHQHQRQHGHAVEREVERAHHAEGGDYRTGNGDRGDQGRAPGAHEEKHDQAGQNAAEDQVRFNFVQGGLDVARLIANDFQLDVCGQLGGHSRQFSA